MFHFKYTASEVYDILESENFFDAEVYLQPSNDGLNSDEDSDSELVHNIYQWWCRECYRFARWSSFGKWEKILKSEKILKML